MSDPDRFQLRRLEATDYQKQHLALLGQLTRAGDYDEETWQGIFRSLTAQPDVYYIAVIEDTESQKVVGSASLVIEQKFLRNGGKCGHIEDVVVDSACRGHRLGLRLIEHLVAVAKERGCYKIILDCSEENAAFYSKAGFRRKEVQMALYYE